MSEETNGIGKAAIEQSDVISKVATEQSTVISKLATETFKVLTSTMFDEVKAAITTFSALAEKGTVIFLQATGAVLIVLAIVLAWRSESVFESLTDRFIEQSSQSHNSPSRADGLSQMAQLPAKQAISPDFRVQFGALQFFILVSSGTILILAGSVISVATYKWRIDSFRMAQSLDKESLALQVTLRQSGIRALAESQKAIVTACTSPPKSGGKSEPMADPGQFK